MPRKRKGRPRDTFAKRALRVRDRALQVLEEQLAGGRVSVASVQALRVLQGIVSPKGEAVPPEAAPFTEPLTISVAETPADFAAAEKRGAVVLNVAGTIGAAPEPGQEADDAAANEEGKP